MTVGIARNSLAGAPRKVRLGAQPGLAIALLAALAVVPFAPAIGVELMPVDKTKFEFTTFEDKPGIRAIVGQPMTIKLGGAFGMMGYRYVLEAGTYRDVRQTRINGREYVVLPVRETLHGETYSGTGNSLGALGGCYSSDGYFIAVDVLTGDVLNRSLLRNRRSESCGGGARMDWYNTLSEVEAPGDVQILWGAEARVADQRELDNAVKGQIVAAVTDAETDRATLPQKLQVGARICRLDGSVRYVGFTERVSPDNGKIQIRVVEATIGSSANLRPRDFQPTIIWAQPDQWEICE